MRRGIQMIFAGLLGFFAISFAGYGQSEPMFSQYMLNGLVINPAYAGIHGSPEFTLLYRNQWTGINGAPETFTLSFNTLLGNKKSGVGINIVQDKIGITSQTIVNGAYAYKIPFHNGSLSLGLTGQVNFINFDYQDLNLQVDSDPFLINQENQTDISFGAGIVYHDEKLYLGFSMPHLTRSGIFSKHWFIEGAYLLSLSSTVKLKPSVLVKYVNGAPLEIDINGTAYWNDKLWIGASFRSFAGIYALTGINVSDNLGIGYAFDLNTTTLGPYAAGTHEVLLRYRFGFKNSKIITPRYF